MKICRCQYITPPAADYACKSVIAPFTQYQQFPARNDVMGHTIRKIINHKLVQLSLVAFASATGFWGGHKVDLAVERQSIITALDQDGSQLLSRLELVIDQSHSELKKLAKLNLGNCNVDALAAARMTMLSRGTIKDIEVRGPSGNLNCSTTISDAESFAKPNPNWAIELPDAKSEILIGIAENKPDGLLQLRKVLQSKASLNAFVGLDSLLYSFFDPGVRDMASVGIYFDQTKPVAIYGEIQSIRKEAGGFDSDLRSKRFPLSVRLSVPEKSIAHLADTRNSLSEWLLAVAGGLLAALGSYLAISIFVRPPNPLKELASAIERDEIVPFYQPIIKLSDESISGCEMLVRWIKPDGTMVRPDLFIPLAESSGLVVDMTIRVLKRAIRDLAPIISIEKDFKLAVNIAPDHFSSPGFVPSILKVLEEEKLNPCHLVLELTERQQLQDLEAFKAIAEAVQRSGLRISIDDVGTGHNGLSTIQEVPADIIKVDKKFVDTVATNELSAAIVAMLVGLSKQFGRTIVAEGIETRDQLDALLAQGVDEGQGYLFSPALNALKFVAFYGAQRDVAKSVGKTVLVKAAA
jgi:c-di-GMP phosphodiesterase